MAFETLKASIYTLLDEIAGQPTDPHVLHEQLETTLAELRGLGQPLPQDLVDLDAWLGEALSIKARTGTFPAPPQHLLPRQQGRRKSPPEVHPTPHAAKDN